MAHLHMANLPDELWRRIMEIGIEKSKKILSYKDLCCISITCTRFNRLSNEDFIWAHLFSSDFPQFGDNTNSSSLIHTNPPFSKTLYKIRFERDRARKVAARQRAVLRVESRIAQHMRKVEEIQLKKSEEIQRMKATVLELSNLKKARQASVALNVWQPEVVRGSHKQIVEQSPVPAVSRIHALEMEIKLCKQQIKGFDNAYRDETRRLEEAREQLTSLKYHPLQVDNFTNEKILLSRVKRKKKEKGHISKTPSMQIAT